MEKRSFTILQIKKTGQKCKTTKSDGGRFVSTTPSGAARKAFTAACHSKKIRGQCSFTVKMRETTAASAKKEFVYELKRVKLTKPLIIKRGSTEVKIEYTTIIKSLN